MQASSSILSPLFILVKTMLYLTQASKTKKTLHVACE